MEPSELPPFPVPEPPPPTPVATPAGRGMPMFLQALFLLAFWPAVYFTHEHTAALIAAEQQVREQEQREQERKDVIERIAGRWISAHGDSAILNFNEERFTLRQTTTIAFGWFRVTEGLPVLRGPEGQGYRVLIHGDELAIEFGEFGRQYFERRDLPWNGVWRFRRLKK